MIGPRRIASRVDLLLRNEARLQRTRELSLNELEAVHGGFIRELLTFIKRLPYEDEMGEECNNGICVPYIEPGDY